MRATSGKLITILAAALLAAALPAPAANAGETVPPGNGEADQYAETVPGAGGDETPGGSLQPDDVLSPGQVDELESDEGSAGSGLAAFVAATAPSDGTTGGAAADDDGGSGAGGEGSEGDNSGAPSPAAAVATGPGEDGLGVSLWLIIALAAAGAIAFAVRQRSAAARR